MDFPDDLAAKALLLETLAIFEGNSAKSIS